ncbi:MAG: Mur ligase family protein, partial [Ilumatobacteraceae bacterium]
MTALAAPTAPIAPIDLGEPKRLHVVGVGGPGMSAIAIVLAEMGHTVSGSDLREKPVLDRLRAAGVTVRIGHDRAHVHGVDAVTASTAVPSRNVELDEARQRGSVVLRRAGMLAGICAKAKSLAVAGTHGKTTTSSMLMLVLAEAGWRPSFVIGGDVTDMGTGAQWTGGEWFVVEADESDGTHLELPLHATILTNVEVDHLDHYGSFEGIVAGFERYLGQIAGPKVLCADDEICVALAAAHGAVTYGFADGADFRAVDVHAETGSFRFAVEHHGVRLGEVLLPLRGTHNVQNATAVVAMAVTIGVPFDVVAAALARFG